MRPVDRCAMRVVGFMMLAVAMASGCERTAPTPPPSAGTGARASAPLPVPPVVTAGSDSCAECSMLVQKENFCALLVVARGGATERIAFDDLGCFFDYRFEHKDDAAISAANASVHDYASEGWAGAKGAFYVAAEPARLATPMNSGLVAFATRETAGKLALEVEGQVLDLEGAAAWRRAYMEKKYGKREPGGR